MLPGCADADPGHAVGHSYFLQSQVYQAFIAGLAVLLQCVPGLGEGKIFFYRSCRFFLFYAGIILIAS